MFRSRKESKYDDIKLSFLLSTQILTVICLLLQLADQIAPLRQRKNSKNNERDRVRSELKVEEQRLSERLNSFLMYVERFHNLNSEIDRFLASNKIEELKRLQDEEGSIIEQEKEQENLMKEMEPGLKAIESKLNNQERHKKTIQSNIDILQAMDRLKELDDRLVLMDDEIKSVKGVNEAKRAFQTASENIKKYEAEKNRREGSKDAIRAQQRDLKVNRFNLIRFFIFGLHFEIII